MAQFQKLDNELVIASIESNASSIFLTNLRIFQQNTNGSHKNSNIIPVDNIDSFGLIKSESKRLLALAVLSAVFGILQLIMLSSEEPEIASQQPIIGIGLLLLAAFFLICWQLSKKTGIAIYSLSGKTEIFLQATGKNQKELLDFVQSIQNWLFLKKPPSSNPAP